MTILNLHLLRLVTKIEKRLKVFVLKAMIGFDLGAIFAGLHNMDMSYKYLLFRNQLNKENINQKFVKNDPGIHIYISVVRGT